MPTSAEELYVMKTTVLTLMISRWIADWISLQRLGILSFLNGFTSSSPHITLKPQSDTGSAPSEHPKIPSSRFVYNVLLHFTSGALLNRKHPNQRQFSQAIPSNMLSSHFLGFIALHVASVCSSPLQHNWNSTYQTAYFQDNDPAGSSVIALKISNVDGTLSNPVRTSTGGKGITGALGVSQDSVVVSENVRLTAWARFAALLISETYSTSLSPTLATTPCPCSPSIPRTPSTPPSSESRHLLWAKHLSQWPIRLCSTLVCSTHHPWLP